MKPSQLLTALAASLVLPLSAQQSMDEMWGGKAAKEGVETSERAALFRDGNYGMFIHWGLYSHLGGQWQDRTFYGIGEWTVLDASTVADAATTAAIERLTR